MELFLFLLFGSFLSVFYVSFVVLFPEPYVEDFSYSWQLSMYGLKRLEMSRMYWDLSFYLLRVGSKVKEGSRKYLAP